MRIKDNTFSMSHWNDSYCVSIGALFTGPEPGYHEIVQLAILCLDTNFKPRDDVKPLWLNIKCEHPERLSSKLPSAKQSKIAELSKSGFDTIDAGDRVIEWAESMDRCQKLGEPRPLIPLGFNYALTREFLIRLLTRESYEYIFHTRYRDPVVVASFLDDLAAMQAEKPLFTIMTPRRLCVRTGVEPYTNMDEAMPQAVKAPEVYAKMTTKWRLIR